MVWDFGGPIKVVGSVYRDDGGWVGDCTAASNLGQEKVDESCYRFRSLMCDSYSIFCFGISSARS